MRERLLLAALLGAGAPGCAPKRPPAAGPSGGCPTSPVPADSLQALGEEAGVLVGVALGEPPRRRAGAWDALVRTQFASITPEWVLKWAPVQPVEGVWDFSRVDPVVACAEARGQRLKGHTLVWHVEHPAWLDRARSLVGTHMAEHVRTTVSRYRGRVAAWDVANEVMDDEGGLRRDLLTEELGEGWLDTAFAEARAADPEALLLLNETGVARQGAKQAGFLALLERLLEREVPVDGVGLQLHQHGTHPVGPTELRRSLAAFSDLGLRIEVSELDVRLTGLAGHTAARDQVAAVIVGETVAACVESAACEAVTVWGVGDGDSWLLGEPGGRRDRPLLYDRRYTAKPARTAFAEALRGRRPEVCEVVTIEAPDGATGGLLQSGESGGSEVVERTEAWHGPSLDLLERVDARGPWWVGASLWAEEASEVRLTLRVRQAGEDRFHRLGGYDLEAATWTPVEAVLALPEEARGAEELVLYAEGPAPGLTLAVKELALGAYCQVP